MGGLASLSWMVVRSGLTAKEPLAAIKEREDRRRRVSPSSP